MFKPSRTERAAVRTALAATAAFFLFASPAFAAPMVMGPLYVEPSHGTPPAKSGGCAVRVAELADDRRDPETLGAIGGFRAIKAPSDREAWLRSIFETGLSARGFKASFGADDNADPTALTARVHLKSFWVSTLATNKTASVALKAAVGRGGSGDPEKIYRSDKISINMWGSQSEFNGIVNDVFAEALDDLAEDLRAACAAAPTTPAQAEPAAPPQAPPG